MCGENNTKIKSQTLSVKKNIGGPVHLGASPILCVERLSSEALHQ